MFYICVLFFFSKNDFLPRLDEVILMSPSWERMARLMESELQNAWYMASCRGVSLQHTICSILTGRYLESRDWVRRMIHLRPNHTDNRTNQKCDFFRTNKNLQECKIRLIKILFYKKSYKITTLECRQYKKCIIISG